MSLNILLILPGVIGYYCRVQVIVIDSSIAMIFNQYIANVTSFYMRLLLGSINWCHCCPLTSQVIDSSPSTSKRLKIVLHSSISSGSMSADISCLEIILSVFLFLERMLTFWWNNTCSSWNWWNCWYLLECWITFSWHVLFGTIVVCTEISGTVDIFLTGWLWRAYQDQLHCQGIRR